MAIYSPTYDPQNCERCDYFARYGLLQVYGYLWDDQTYENPGPYYFDVALARALVSDGRAPKFDVRQNVGISLSHDRIWPEHFEHVQPATLIPIVAKVPLRLRGDPGREVMGMPFIDGKHVAARLLVEGMSMVRFHVLTPEETRAVLIKDLEAWALATGQFEMIKNVILVGGREQ